MCDPKIKLLPRRQFVQGAIGCTIVSALATPKSTQAQPSADWRTADEFINSVGACTHFGHKGTPYISSFHRLLDEMQSLGIKHLRDDGIITRLGPSKDLQYRRMRELVDIGFRFSLICYDATNPYVFTPPDFVERLYDACNGGIEIFEGGNEPNLAKDPSYASISAQHQRELYHAVKSNSKLAKIPVLGPSYIQKSIPLAKNLSEACDYSNIHAYAGMEHPETLGPGQLQKYIDASRGIFGEKSVIASEMGYHTALETNSGHLPVSESTKARYLPRMLLWSFLNGVKRCYIYEMISSFNRGNTDPESSFGLLDFRLERTAAFDAVKSLMDLCGVTMGAKKTFTNLPTVRFAEMDKERHHLLLTKEDGTLLVPVWLGVDGWDRSNKSVYPPVERAAIIALSRPCKTAIAHRFDDRGKTTITVLAPDNDDFRFTLSDQLTVIEFAL